MKGGGWMIIKYSKDVDENIISDLIRIESLAYEEKYRGEYESIEARYKKNKDTFILAYDQGMMVGYLCFLPISDTLYHEILEIDTLHDDDISPSDVMQFYDGVNVYIVSISIIPQYQNTEAVKEMTNAFFQVLKEKRQENICINDLLASAVTYDGEKYLKNQGFKKIKTVDGQYSLYILPYSKEWMNYE